ncbi:MAG: TIGR04255 family protein [Gallionellaceae bacterium]
MGTPLKNPPVYLTLAQVRFNPILKLADFLPGIQENFRHAGYTDFESKNLISIQVTMQDGQPTPTPIQQERFQFGNAEKTHMFILDGQSLTLQSTNYGQFETFSACFLKGLNIVNDIVKLAFTERVGLRYLDRVMPQDGETIEQYLVEQVHGLTSRLSGKPLYSYTEAMNEIENIKLLSRVAIQDGPLAFPPDLQPGNMRVTERFLSHTGKSAILDNDGFVEGREAFSAKAVADHLDAIHKVIGAAFKTTATPYAFSAWDK